MSLRFTETAGYPKCFIDKCCFWEYNSDNERSDDIARFAGMYQESYYEERKCLFN